ncbi:hypothetical protein WDW89_24850 [Deltaproteobacteria bacterium TL4]
MVIHSKIKDLFQCIKDCDLKTKLWVAHAIGYTATADGVIQPSEMPYLTAMFALLKDEGMDVTSLAQSLMRVKQRPPLEPLEVPQHISEHIFTFILGICSADGQIQDEELIYLDEVYRALGLDYERKEELMEMVLGEASEALNQITQPLNK